LNRIVEQAKVDGERGIEVLPSHATPPNLDQLADLGFNYLSLGIQSFDKGVLDHLQRPNTATENHRALAATIGRFDCVDVDLIFDVAFESPQIFLRDLEVCFRAGVEQVSTYPLMRFGYTPFGKTNHDPEEEQRILRVAAEMAANNGYERRSVWTFCRQGSPNYTSITREFYLGCGAGSGSFCGSLFFLNHFSIPAYVEKVDSGQLPIARQTRMSARRAAAYYLFWQTYTGQIDIERFEALFPAQRLQKAILSALQARGLLKRSGAIFELTPSGYDRYHDLERWVTYHLIEPLWADMMREHTHLRGVVPALSRSDRFWLHLSGLRP
jgi:oxygen-independent coproporphyrinogen-3 oxidase